MGKKKKEKGIGKEEKRKQQTRGRLIDIKLRRRWGGVRNRKEQDKQKDKYISVKATN